MRNITPSNKKYLLPLKLVNSTHGAALPLVTFLPPDQSVNIKPYQMVSSADRIAIELLISKLEKNPRFFTGIEQLAGEVNMGTTRFKKVFKEVTGFSPINYRKIIILQRAKLQLEETSLSVAVVSQRAGYRSVSSFVRAFKELTGVTPHQFRSKSFLLLVLNTTFLHIFSV